MGKSQPISFTQDQLKKFYLQAYNDGRDAKNVCGGLSKLAAQDISIKRMASAIFAAFTSKD